MGLEESWVTRHGNHGSLLDLYRFDLLRHYRICHRPIWNILDLVHLCATAICIGLSDRLQPASKVIRAPLYGLVAKIEVELRSFGFNPPERRDLLEILDDHHQRNAQPGHRQ